MKTQVSASCTKIKFYQRHLYFCPCEVEGRQNEVRHDELDGERDYATAGRD